MRDGAEEWLHTVWRRGSRATAHEVSNRSPFSDLTQHLLCKISVTRASTTTDFYHAADHMPRKTAHPALVDCLGLFGEKVILSSSQTVLT